MPKRLTYPRGEKHPNWKEVDGENLRELYIAKEMPAVKIAKILGMSPTTILKKLQFYGIPTRTMSEIKRGTPSPKKGTKMPESAKQKESETVRKKWANPEFRQRMVEKRRQQAKDPSWIRAQAEGHKRTYRENPDLVRKMLTCQKPNRSERELQSLCEQHNLPFKYVGNGEFILGGKCPDFVNVNGKKQLIELFGECWHDIFDIARRKEHFRQYGFDTLIIWEEELKDQKKLVKKLKRFAREQQWRRSGMS